jgi:hypothetical protein
MCSLKYLSVGANDFGCNANFLVGVVAGCCPVLEELDIRACGVTRLPVALASLTRLVTLDCRNNAFVFPPQSTVDRGLKAIMEFLRTAVDSDADDGVSVCTVSTAAASQQSSLTLRCSDGDDSLQSPAAAYVSPEARARRGMAARYSVTESSFSFASGNGVGAMFGPCGGGAAGSFRGGGSSSVRSGVVYGGASCDADDDDAGDGPLTAVAETVLSAPLVMLPPG